MKIRGNIIAGAKLVLSAIRVNKYIAPIEKAKAEGDIEEEKKRIAEVCGAWVNNIIDIYDIHFHISGQENIPEDPCVFIANHQAYCDVMAILKATEGKQVSFIAKDGFKGVPYLAPWILRTRGLFIPTNSSDVRESLHVINKGVELVKLGFSMVIFPEGKRSWGPEMNEFKPGSFKLATKAKVPVVPITIDGTYHMFEEKERITSGQHAWVVIHPPIETKDLTKEEQKELPDRVHEIIRNALPLEPEPQEEENALDRNSGSNDKQ